MFGNLEVIEHLGIQKKVNVYLCKCTCGNTREVSASNLLRNIVDNCGCRKFIRENHANRKYEPKEASFRAKAANYIAQAKHRKILLELTYDEIIELLKGDCFYCGAKPSNRYNVRERNRKNKMNKNQYAANNIDGYDILYSGIDRVENSLGYIKNNTVSCCFRCNTAKLDYNLESFKEWISIVNKRLNNNEE